MTSRAPTTPTVGVLGGTFDPVHLGHLAIARRAHELLALDRILLVPTAVPPHKPAERMAPAADRYAMLSAAITGEPGLELSALEMAEDRVSYTYETLCSLARAPHPCRPLFVLGLDALAGIESWYEWRRLVAEFDLAAVGRPGAPNGPGGHVPAAVRERLVEPSSEALPEGWRRLDPGAGGRIFLLPIEPLPISSSLVRARVARGEDLSALVPPAVARYIRESRLYRNQEERH